MYDGLMYDLMYDGLMYNSLMYGVIKSNDLFWKFKRGLLFSLTLLYLIHANN